jgi:hypothetical protein
METTLEAAATYANPEGDEVSLAEEERLLLIAEELREAIRRKLDVPDR